ncbi:leucine Rich repeat-containing domain protein [Ancylostoma duodenale]|uniref:Leucine Rich repeat-containing domain protein n=1 Tax=Ancylostoma duodenale TaxID=51022 RepID=A0A0C2FYC7_9BILA|nr:leucine Rich repeat-containing domain protein [Ancylostoma duodenale]
MSSLRLIEWTERGFSLDILSSLSSLSKLAVVQSKMHSVSLFARFPSITELVLNENAFSDFEQFCNLTRSMPKLLSLSLNENQFTHLPDCITDVAVRTLNLRKNQIAYINGTFNEYTHIVDLSRNALRSASGFHANTLRLNLSYNPLTEVTFPPFLLLQQLDLSGTRFVISPRLNAPKLVEFYMDQSTVEMVDFTQWTLPSLQRLSMIDSFSLKFISGQLPKSTKEFSVTNTQLSAFPQSFFSGVLESLESTDYSYAHDSLQKFGKLAAEGTPGEKAGKYVAFEGLGRRQAVVTKSGKLDCDGFRLRSMCFPVVGAHHARLGNCTLGISEHDPEIVRAEYGQSAILSCTAYGSPQPDIEWWRYRPATYLGAFHPLASDRVSATNSWLDYSNWYSLDLFNSVFWGGIATAVLVCSFSFLLNITWILTRKSILWWIQRAERLSRVRKMVEAMEKYRVRQMEGLHEKYTRRMQLVEALRVSYSSQAERFRDYRAAQMEQMSSHLENIRENYNQQMQRVREYGSRRAEQLWESYERQVGNSGKYYLSTVPVILL